jgi:hypothetical protein
MCQSAPNWTAYTTKLVPAWFTSTRGVYLTHVQNARSKLPISPPQIVGSVIFMGNHHQDHLDLKYSCVRQLFWAWSSQVWKAETQWDSSCPPHSSNKSFAFYWRFQCLGGTQWESNYFSKTAIWQFLNFWTESKRSHFLLLQKVAKGKIILHRIISLVRVTNILSEIRNLIKLRCWVGQILGSVIFMDNHHLTGSFRLEIHLYKAIRIFRIVSGKRPPPIYGNINLRSS